MMRTVPRVSSAPRAGPTAIAAALAAAAIAALASAALAAEPDRYALSHSPYAKVGQLDPALSRACRRLQFNERQAHRYYIGYIGPVAPGTTGIAKRGWNLIDPLRLARPAATYHFFNDGYSNCKVFVASEPAGRR